MADFAPNWLWFAWNNSLALIPVGLVWLWVALAVRRERAPRLWHRPVLAGLGAVWLAFLPNTCYLLTEWRHFLEVVTETDLYPRWQGSGETGAMLGIFAHALFYFTYSAVGLLTFVLALRPLAHWAGRHRWPCGLLGLGLFPLVALGVYLGLILRFNSWDLVVDPSPVLAAIREVLTRPRLLLFLGTFSLFLWGAYLAVDIWLDGLALRWRRPAASARCPACESSSRT
jgi:uncharacterized membrane protein